MAQPKVNIDVNVSFKVKHTIDQFISPDTPAGDLLKMQQAAEVEIQEVVARSLRNYSKSDFNIKAKASLEWVD